MIRLAFRRYPATVAGSAAVTIGFIAQWLLPTEALLQRDPVAIAGGQWWRLITSVLVQGSGWGQFLFNTLGMVVIGVAVERTRGTALWLIAALVAQVGASLCALWWAPEVNDSGSSLVVGGLVGLLTVTRFVRPPRWAGLAAAYRVFFVTYLAGLALAGPVEAAVAGSVLTGLLTSLLLRTGWARRSSMLVLLVVVVASGVLVAARDQHGVAVLLGVVVGLLADVVVPHQSRATDS